MNKVFISQKKASIKSIMTLRGNIKKFKRLLRRNISKEFKDKVESIIEMQDITIGLYKKDLS